MSVQRTVLVESISYLGTDGVDHVGHRGDKITVAAEGVQHFDWVQGGSVEGRADAEAKVAAAAEKAGKKAAAPAAEGKKA